MFLFAQVISLQSCGAELVVDEVTLSMNTRLGWAHWMKMESWRWIRWE